MEPQFLNAPAETSAQELRTAFSAPFQEGILDAGDLAVVPGAAGLSVDVGVGEGFIQGDAVPDQGLYRFRNDATKNSAAFALGGIPPAHATLPTIHTLVARIYDHDADGSGLRAWRFEIVAGTPTSGATLANRSGAPSLPGGALRLADLRVPAASAGPMLAADIGNPNDPRAATLVSVAGAPPQYACGRPATFPGRVRAYNSANFSVPNAALTAVLMNSELWDTGTIHDTSALTSRLTCKVPGLHDLKAYLDFAGNATNQRGVGLLLGGSFYIFGPEYRNNVGASLVTGVLAATEYALAWGDYIEVMAFQNSGGALNVNVTSLASPHAMASWKSV